jgi:hypothetical protein
MVLGATATWLSWKLWMGWSTTSSLNSCAIQKMSVYLVHGPLCVINYSRPHFHIETEHIQLTILELPLCTILCASLWMLSPYILHVILGSRKNEFFLQLCYCISELYVSVCPPIHFSVCLYSDTATDINIVHANWSFIVKLGVNSLQLETVLVDSL